METGRTHLKDRSLVIDQLQSLMENPGGQIGPSRQQGKTKGCQTYYIVGVDNNNDLPRVILKTLPVTNRSLFEAL